MKEDPYDVLGVSPDAPMDIVRAAYLQAARMHHPDKLGHLDAEERSKHEAIFKNMTNAYSCIVEARGINCNAASSEAFMREWSAPKRPDEWEAIWEGVERMFSKSDVIKDLFVQANALKKKWAAAHKRANEKQEPHKATLTVSAADVQIGKLRRVRLLLNEGAINLNVDCSVFPNVFKDENVEIKLVVKEDEAAEYEDGVWDLFRTVNVNLVDWFTGGEHYLDPFVTGGEPLSVQIPSCASIETPICISNQEFWKFGPIYVSVQLILPTTEEWKTVENTNQEKLLALLRDVVCKST